jgi:hypothetical protein
VRAERVGKIGNCRMCILSGMRGGQTLFLYPQALIWRSNTLREKTVIEKLSFGVGRQRTLELTGRTVASEAKP